MARQKSNQISTFCIVAKGFCRNLCFQYINKICGLSSINITGITHNFCGTSISINHNNSLESGTDIALLIFGSSTSIPSRGYSCAELIMLGMGSGKDLAAECKVLGGK